MNLDYNTGVPATNDNPSDDQPPMLTNTNSINSWVGIDHHGFADNLGGYHTIIHQDVQFVDPAQIAGINQIYTKNYTPDTAPPSLPDTQLFNRTGNGGISQLTGDNSISEGYQWVGGVLIQWGGVITPLNISNKTGMVTFQSRSPGNTIPFPNKLFIVNATLLVNGITPARNDTISIDFVNSDNTRFTWFFTGSSSSNYAGFWWVAIGN